MRIKMEDRRETIYVRGTKRFQQTLEDDYARYIERPAKHQEIQGCENR